MLRSQRWLVPPYPNLVRWRCCRYCDHRLWHALAQPRVLQVSAVQLSEEPDEHQRPQGQYSGIHPYAGGKGGENDQQRGKSDHEPAKQRVPHRGHISTTQHPSPEPPSPPRHPRPGQNQDNQASTATADQTIAAHNAAINDTTITSITSRRHGSWSAHRPANPSLVAASWEPPLPPGRPRPGGSRIARWRHAARLPARQQRRQPDLQFFDSPFGSISPGLGLN